MTITRTIYPRHRSEWRAWLRRHHAKAKEIWVIYYKKGSGRPRIPYDDAVEEALCFGWIDGIVKSIDKMRFTQRFTPRKAGSQWSESNRERFRRLVAGGKMTEAGLKVFPGGTSTAKKKPRFRIPSDIQEALRRDKSTWKNFQRFPESYRRIRVAWIEGARTRPDIFRTRLRYFLKMTKMNKRYGMVQ